MAVVRFPNNTEIQQAFERYAVAVGRVAYSWNRFHEILGELFAAIGDANRQEAFAQWYSIRSDYLQRRLLETTAKALAAWPSPFELRAEILWVIGEADILSHERNDAIHAPATLYVGHDADKVEMGARFFTGHPRAENLKGKNLLTEFRRCEEWSDQLQEYAEAIRSTWRMPDKFGLPLRPLRTVI